MTTTEKRILVTLQRHWRWTEGGNSWRSMKHLAEHVRRPEKEVRKACRSLAKLGILKHESSWYADGQMHGSGYFLQGKWEPDLRPFCGFERRTA